MKNKTEKSKLNARRRFVTVLPTTLFGKSIFNRKGETSMKRNIINISLSFVLSLTLLSISAMAQATTFTRTDTFPISSTISVTGCLDSVAVEGVARVVTHSTVSSSGEVNVRQGINFIGRGISLTTGARYVVKSVLEGGSRFDSLDSAPFNMTTTGNSYFIGQGQVPDLIERNMAHTTINANGEVTSMRIESSIECRQ